MLDRGRRGNVQRKRRFSHRRSGRDDDQIPTLQPRRHPVEVCKAGGHARDARTRFLELLDMLEGLPEDLLDREESLPLLSLCNLKDPLLGLVEKLFDVPLTLLVSILDDVARLLDQSPRRAR
jgi:hypothetical protein